MGLIFRLSECRGLYWWSFALVIRINYPPIVAPIPRRSWRDVLILERRIFMGVLDGGGIQCIWYEASALSVSGLAQPCGALFGLSLLSCNIIWAIADWFLWYAVVVMWRSLSVHTYIEQLGTFASRFVSRACLYQSALADRHGTLQIMSIAVLKIMKHI